MGIYSRVIMGSIAAVVWGRLVAYMQWLHRIAVMDPLYTLYINGPSIHSWGFWGARENSDICTSISSVPSDFWALHETDCELLIQSRFQGFYLTVAILAYLYLVMRTLHVVSSIIVDSARLY